MVEVSQLPIELTLRWRAGDPVSLAVVVSNLDWSGTHTASVGGVAMTVTAVFGGVDTIFTFSLTTGQSASVAATKHEFWCKTAAGLTLFAGTAVVES